MYVKAVQKPSLLMPSYDLHFPPLLIDPSALPVATPLVQPMTAVLQLRYVALRYGMMENAHDSCKVENRKRMF